jgi:hypothetical protein
MASRKVGSIEGDLTLNNRQFEAAVKKSTKSADKLSGDLMGLAKNSKAADGGMDNLSEGLDKVAGSARRAGTDLGGMGLAKAARDAEKAGKSLGGLADQKLPPGFSRDARGRMGDPRGRFVGAGATPQGLGAGVGMGGGMGGATEGLSGVGSAAGKATKNVVGLGNAFNQLAVAAGAAGAAMAAFNLAEAAAGAATAEKAFTNTGGNIEKLRQSVQGMVSDAEIIKKRNLAQTMGISGETFQKLAKVAQVAAAGTGQSFEYMFDSIVTGTARSSKMILDNLGILVSQEDANKRYAAANGLVAKSLTDVQKKQAFTNEVMRQGDEMMKRFGLSAADLIDPFAQARASMANIAEDIGALLIPGFSKLISLLLPVGEFIDKMRTAFDNLSPGMKDMVGTVSAIAIGLTTLVGVAGTVSVAFMALAPVFAAVKVALLAALAPLIKFVIIAAGAAAIAGTLRAAWEDNLGGIQDKFKAFYEVARTIFASIQDMAVKVGNFLARAFDAVFDFIVDAATVIPRAMGFVVEKVSGKVIEVVLLIEKVINRLAGTKFGQMLGLDRVDLGGVKAFARELGQGGARFNASIDNAVELFKEFANPRKLVATAISGAGETADTVGEAIKTGGDYVAKGWGLLWEDMQKGLKSFGIDFTKKLGQEQKKAKPPAAPPTGAGGAAKAGAPVVPVMLVGDAPPGMGVTGPAGPGLLDTARAFAGDISAVFGQVSGVVRELTQGIRDFTAQIGDERIADSLIATLGTLVMGGPMQALIAALPLVPFQAALLAATIHTESFGMMQRMVQASFQRVIDAMEPFAEAFFPIVGLLDAFMDVFIALADSLMGVDFIARGLFEVLKGVALQLTGFVLGAAMAQNAMLEFGFGMLRVVEQLANLIGIPLPALAEMRAGLLGMRVDTDALGEAFVGLAELTYEDADQRARNLLLGEEQNDQLQESVNINVPEVFKLEAERFKAIQEGLGASTADLGLAETTGAGGGESNFYGDIYIDAAGMDPEQLAEAISNIRGQINAEQSGNPNGRGSRNGGGL